jgi:hypothetical protein
MTRSEKTKRSATAKTGRSLALMLFFYAQSLAFIFSLLQCEPGCAWFWTNFFFFSLGVFLGTFFWGEYRHYERIENQ